MRKKHEKSSPTSPPEEIARLIGNEELVRERGWKSLSHQNLNEPPDEAPEWTDEQLARAELAEGGKVIRPAQGTLTRPRGRPRVDSPKAQISVRLDTDVLAALRASGPGWQARMNDELRKALGL
ncbi:BrnA antitoxin family protein [Aquabacter spiritensis]|uniref:BrnA antitoxin family protein n=1 Tax=Aquabacter spiritensis TaxID=933073 RepID=UPI00104B7E9B|nr:BrnA antitoxin family protein [Aquabacter spiritensis]